MNKLNFACVLALSLFVAGVVGCGPQLPYEVVPLEGTITCDGKPVKNCTFFFMPNEGRSSTCLSDENGHFLTAYTPQKAGVQAGQGHFYFVPTPGLGAVAEGEVSLSALAGAYPRGNDKLVFTFEKGDKNFELKLTLEK